MLSIPKFVYDFANYRSATICQNKLMQKDIAAKALSKIEKALHFVEQGYITIDEAMQYILKCFEQ